MFTLEDWKINIPKIMATRNKYLKLLLSLKATHFVLELYLPLWHINKTYEFQL